MITKLIANTIQSNVARYIELTNPATQELLSALENSWVQGTNQISIPFWSKQIGNQLLTKITFGLSQANWVQSSVRGNFGIISFNQDTINEHLTNEEQTKLRTKLRIAKYRMRCVEEVQPSNLTKTPSGIRETGLNRPGFAYSANQKFSLDTQYIVKYYDAIHANALKSIEKMAVKHRSIYEDSANYGIIVSDILDWHLFNPDAQFNMERNINDQRGRSIYGGLKRVFNPIASKDARSMMKADRGIVVTSSNQAQLDDIFLFIAELIGTKPTSWEAKKLTGMDCYNTRDLHKLDLTNEDDRKELHENIWLERIYNKLDDVYTDGYAYWDIPLEMDQTALKTIGAV